MSSVILILMLTHLVSYHSYIIIKQFLTSTTFHAEYEIPFHCTVAVERGDIPPHLIVQEASAYYVMDILSKWQK